MGIATVSGNRITDSGVNIFDSPTFPTVTQNGKAIFNFYPLTGNMVPVFPSTYFGRVVYVPQLNKTYPDTSIGYKCYGDILNSNFVISGSGSTTHTVSNVEMLYFTGTLTVTMQVGFVTMTYADLKHVTAGLSFSPSGTVLQTYAFPELISMIGVLTLASSTCPINIVAPKLEIISGGITLTGTGLVKLDFPAMLVTSGLIMNITSTSLTQINLPNLKFVQYGVQWNLAGTFANLTSINLSSLEYMGATFFRMPLSSPALTSFTFGSSLKYFEDQFVTTSNSLNQASVDNILISLAALDGSGSTIIYTGKTVTITGGAATPSAAGLAAKATLVARSCTVTTN
jgi:hypothetical protein